MSSPNVPSVYMGLQLKESKVVIYLNHLSFTFGVLRKKNTDFNEKENVFYFNANTIATTTRLNWFFLPVVIISCHQLKISFKRILVNFPQQFDFG